MNLALDISKFTDIIRSERLILISGNHVNP